MFRRVLSTSQVLKERGGGRGKRGGLQRRRSGTEREGEEFFEGFCLLVSASRRIVHSNTFLAVVARVADFSLQ